MEGGGRGGRGSNYPPLFPGEIQSNKSSDRWHKDFGIIRTPNVFKEIGKNANSSVNVISVKVSYCYVQVEQSLKLRTFICITETFSKLNIVIGRVTDSH